jgi:hypothetical protein
MGSYSPPPLKLEVEKSSWSEIGRIYIAYEDADHSQPQHIFWDEKRRIAVYSTPSVTLSLNFANFTYTAQNHGHFVQVSFADKFTFSIGKKYETRRDSSTSQYIVRKLDQYIPIPFPSGIPSDTWALEMFNVSPSGRYLVWEFWRYVGDVGDPWMIFVFYR